MGDSAVTVPLLSIVTRVASGCARQVSILVPNAATSAAVGVSAAAAETGNIGVMVGVLVCAAVNVTVTGVPLSGKAAARFVIATPAAETLMSSLSSTASMPLPLAAKGVVSGLKLLPTAAAITGSLRKVLTTSVVASANFCVVVAARVAGVNKALGSPPGATSAATALVSEVTLAALAALAVSVGTTASSTTGVPWTVALALTTSGAFRPLTSML